MFGLVEEPMLTAPPSSADQAIAMLPGRVFEVKDDECVACNLCVNVCPVCSTFRQRSVL